MCMVPSMLLSERGIDRGDDSHLIYLTMMCKTNAVKVWYYLCIINIVTCPLNPLRQVENVRDGS